MSVIEKLYASEQKKKVKVSYLTWIVDESPKAYFQPNPRQVLYLPSTQSRLVPFETVPN